MRLVPAFVVGALVAGFSCAQQWAQLPDNHFLGESATQTHASGSANFWGGATTAGRRFQVLYDGSHFTGIHGVAGAIALTQLAFRGEDTEHNVGGQVFTNVRVDVYRTSLDAAVPLGTTFAANIAAPVSLLIHSTGVLPALTAAASLGRAPNNDVLVIPLPPAPAAYDPTGGLGNQQHLLVDVVYQTASAAPDPQGSTMVAIQDTFGAAAFVRGRAVFASSAAAATGTASSAPPTMRVRFTGSGGFAALTPARNERYGAACGGAPSTFYEWFAHGQYFDLKDPGQVDGIRGLRLVPDQYPSPNFYLVNPTGPLPIDLSATALLPAPTTAGEDDVMVHSLPAGATFSYPGGSTGVVRPSSNGYILVDPGSTLGSAIPNNDDGDFTPTIAELLGDPAAARFCPFWHDFSPAKNNASLPFGDPQSGLHIVNDVANTQVLVTWYRVGRFNSVLPVFQEEHTMQCSLNWATGVVEFRYGQMGEIWGDSFLGTTSGIVGFSRGRIGGVPSVDPRSRDLSIERPFATQVEGAAGHMGQTVVATPLAGGPDYLGRAFGGQSLRWNVDGVPAGALLGVQLLDVGANRPGLELPALLAPGCRLSVTTGAVVWETFVPIVGPSIAGGVPFSVPPGYQPLLQGTDVYAQFVVLDGLGGSGRLITVASEALRHTIGNN